MRDRQYSIEDKYAFKEMVGQGQFGKVYKAKDKLSNSQELYAIKVISKTKFKTNSKLEQLISSEMKVLSEIRNENVVRFIEFGVTCKEVFMVYEFCQGGTLEDKIPLSEKEIIPIFVQIIKAMTQAEKLSILHRDIKPANILFRKGKVKVADWGFSRFLQQGQTTQSFLGSPAYMAPEVLRSEQYTSKADVWSLGVMIYEALYSHCPWEGRNINHLLDKISRNSLRFAPQITVSKTLKSILSQMLVESKDKRITFRQIGKQLGRIADYSNVVPREFSKVCETQTIMSQTKEHPSQLKNQSKNDLSRILECNYFLEMIKISRTISSQNSFLLFIKIIELNLTVIFKNAKEDHCRASGEKDREHGSRDTQGESNQSKNNITRKVRRHSEPPLMHTIINKELQMVRSLKQKCQGKTSARRVSQEWQNPQLQSKTLEGSLRSVMKQVMDYVLAELGKYLNASKNKKQQDDQSSLFVQMKLVQLNLLLDLLVYQQMSEEYNKKSIKNYYQDLTGLPRNLLTRLLNSKLLLIKKMHFDSVK